MAQLVAAVHRNRHLLWLLLRSERRITERRMESKRSFRDKGVPKYNLGTRAE